MGCWVFGAGCLMRGDGCGMPLEGFLLVIHWSMFRGVLRVNLCALCGKNSMHKSFPVSSVKSLCTLW